MRILLISDTHGKLGVINSNCSVFGKQADHGREGIPLGRGIPGAASPSGIPGRTVEEWKPRAGNPDNHWPDRHVGCLPATQSRTGGP